jgi:hypothetical protein
MATHECILAHGYVCVEKKPGRPLGQAPPLRQLSAIKGEEGVSVGEGKGERGVAGGTLGGKTCFFRRPFYDEKPESIHCLVMDRTGIKVNVPRPESVSVFV